MAKSKSRFSRLADYLVYLGSRFIAWILLQLPLRWTFRLGQGLGLFGYVGLAKYRNLVSANLRIAFPEWTKKQVRKNGREHFQTVTANLLCSLVLTQKPHKANSYIDISQLLAAGPENQGRFPCDLGNQSHRELGTVYSCTPMAAEPALGGDLPEAQ